MGINGFQHQHQCSISAKELRKSVTANDMNLDKYYNQAEFIWQTLRKIQMIHRITKYVVDIAFDYSTTT